MLNALAPSPGTNYRADRFYGTLQIPSSHQVLNQASYYVWDCDVHLENDTFYMYYSRWPDSSGWSGWQTDSRIRYATASAWNGPFTDQGEALGVGDPGEWDEDTVHNPYVIQDGSNYRLYYFARQDSPLTRYIGVATSTSITGPWTKSANNPIMTTGSSGAWDEQWISNPAVIKVDGTYYMYYRGAADPTPNDSIGVATASSYDGPFTKHASNPLIDLTPRVEDPRVWEENGVYRMVMVDWDGGYVSGISAIWSESTDLINWTEPEHGYKAMEKEWFTGTTWHGSGRYSVVLVDGKKRYFYTSLVNSAKTDSQISAAEFVQ